MPKALEQRLRAQASKEGMSGRQADHYVYGAMNNIGAMHGNKETPKGARIQAKHVADVKAGRAAPMPRAGTIGAAVKPAGLPHPHRNLGKFLHPRKVR